MVPVLTLASDEIGFLVIGGGLVLAIIIVVTNAIRSMSRERQVEQSRREIAAYVAEGSISPQEGARLLEAGRIPERETATAKA